MSLAPLCSPHHYANLFLFLSANIFVFGAAMYFIMEFGAAMTSQLLVMEHSAPTVFLFPAQNFIFCHGANCILDIGARKYYCRWRTILFLTTARIVFLCLAPASIFVSGAQFYFQFWRLPVFTPLASACTQDPGHSFSGLASCRFTNRRFAKCTFCLFRNRSDMLQANENQRVTAHV